LVPVSVPKNREIERVIRSDASEAHRLSLSARVLSVENGQVKAKRRWKKRFPRLQNQTFAGTRQAHLKPAAADQIAAQTAFYPDNISSLTLSGPQPTRTETKALFAVSGAIMVLSRLGSAHEVH
jgi:hypothetical protein